jgi:hypothetical protein
MAKLDIGHLNKLYKEAEQVDREVHAEMRSNVLLVAGEHYTKRGKGLDKRIRGTADLTENQKLRLTKNHIHAIQRHYVSSILSRAPGVTIDPSNEKELQDVKAAELNKAVWQHAKQKYRLKEKIREWANDHITLGEEAAKIFWDPNAGDVVGYEQKLDPVTGEPMFEDGDELDPMTGLPVQCPCADESKPVFSGDFVFERIFGFNLLRHPAAQSMRDSGKPWIVRKMVDLDTLKEIYKGDADKLKLLAEAKGGDQFVVFDSSKAAYEMAKGQVLIREFYWPKCFEYPNGYFVIATEMGKLEEGELPYGIFPIVWNGCDEFQGSPRKRSIIKVARPYNAEINRASSQLAQTQITVGDDKVLYQNGTKLQQGALLPGVRGISFQGTPPTILPGRDGGQFMPYIEAQVAEMYRACMVPELLEEQQGPMDPYALLHRSIEQTQKFSMYADSFEQFLVDLATLFLELSKKYLPDEALIPAIGRREYINISEFRNTEPLCYQIKVEPMSDTVETKLGKQMALNHVLQYVGTQLGKEDIGRIIRAMPYGNTEEAFGDFTLKYDIAKNAILALDRGQMPVIHETDDSEYLLQRIALRMSQADFDQLPQQAQQNYAIYKQQHEQRMAEIAAKIQAAKDGFIPSGGAMVACDMYVPDEKDPTKAPKRVRMPYQALDWLVQKLAAQGQTLDKMEQMNKGTLSEIADMVLSQGQGQQGMSQGMPQMGQQAQGVFQ